MSWKSHKLLFNLYLCCLLIIAASKKRKDVFDPFSPDRESKNTVIMPNVAGQRYQCIAEVQDKVVKVFSDWMEGKGKIGYADPATNHNLEDQILWAGSKKLFERYGKHPIFSCGAAIGKSFMPPCTPELLELELSQGRGILYFNPGGIWGNLNRKSHLSRLRLLTEASERGIPFVSGPQIIHYEIPEGQTEVKEMVEDKELVEKMASKEDLLTFRSRKSFEFALEHYSNATTVKECPDITFMLGPQTPTQLTKFDVFILMKFEEENKVADKVCRAVMKKGYSCATGDWGDGTNIQRPFGEYPPNYAEIGVQVAIGTISTGQIIVTDRILGVLLSFLAGKPVIYIDAVTKRITNVLYSAFSQTLSCENKPENMGIYEADPDTLRITDLVLTQLAKGTPAIQL